MSSRDSVGLLDRLLKDAGFRARFRADPEAAAREAGFESFTDESEPDPGPALETLEIRQSRSSLAGAMLAAAIEGVAFVELPDHVQPQVAAEGARADAPPQPPVSADTDERPIGDPAVRPVVGDAEAGDEADPGGEADEEESDDEEPDEDEQDEDEDEDDESDDSDDSRQSEDASSDADDPGGQRHPTGPLELGREWKPDPEQYGMAGGGGARSPIDTAVLADPNITLDANGRQDFAEGRMDPRVGAVMLHLAEEHEITLSSTTSDHPQSTAGGSTSNHWYGRAFDVATVDGEIVRPNSAASRALAAELAKLDPSLRPDEIGTPWAISEPGYFTDSAHQDHIHVGFKQAIESRWRPPRDLVAEAPAPGAANHEQRGQNEAIVMPAITPDQIRPE